MAGEDRDTFCREMRKATRQVHTISDTLVNAKLAVGFLDDSVWADGLLVFYEVFRTLEVFAKKWRHTEIGLFPLDELRRTEAFERDLEFYLGKEWKKTTGIRESVANYLQRLREIENTEPVLLIAYIYHLYMGLLSGGIILRKKRQLMRKAWPFEEYQGNQGSNVTTFDDVDIFELKRRMRDTMNDIAENFDRDFKDKLIEESKTVFALNNEIVRSVRGAGANLFRRIMLFTVPLALLLLLFFLSSKK